MGINEYLAAMEDVIYLSSCAVNGVCPDPERLGKMDLERVFQASKRHMMAGICGFALESAGISDAAFTQAKAKAIRKVLVLESEKMALFERLENAGIWYMPLKGSVLKDIYPKLGMREMSDYDILFDAARASEVRDIMESLGFTTESYDRGNHDVYYKPPVCNFEMHRSLFGKNHDKGIFEYYLDVKPRLIKAEGTGFGYRFSDEDFYIYITAHEYKHYSGGGTGLRSLLDIYVYLKNKGDKLRWDYIRESLESLGLTEFEEQNRGLALRLFGDEDLTEKDREMLDFIISSGTYGTEDNLIKNRLKNWGRAGYLLRRAFPGYSAMCASYPILKKLPILLPFCWVLRLINGFIFKNGKFRRQLKAAFK